MALVHSFESSGNKLFRYRGQIPVVLFLLAIPVVYFTNYEFINNNDNLFYILLITCSLISLSGQIIRSIAIGTSNKNTSGRNTKEGQVAEALNTKGIYSTLRHPLYLGNYLMWIGIVAFTFNIYFIIIVSLLFWIYYERIMYAEERFLERKFGDDYVNWSMKVPAFIPSCKNKVKSDIPFSLKTTLRREYSGITATILGFLFVDFLRDWFTSGEVQWKKSHLIVLIVALGISLVFRSLKHYTSLLSESDRS
ncbi:MAG: isoprenylcysteine carboxylmethyltransferase family protein [Crocinitomicaceae bacterium]|nr:isoprenylcysteine carboxylmethyltransferase family protein [Crocinitomicaceae bacterium]